MPAVQGEASWTSEAFLPIRIKFYMKLKAWNIKNLSTITAHLCANDTVFRKALNLKLFWEEYFAHR